MKLFMTIKANKYRLVECPAYFAVEDILSGDRIVTIHTKNKDGVFYTKEEMQERKEFVLKLFNMEK